MDFKQDFVQAVKTCLNQYANFSGRAARPEFWYFFLFMVIVNIATMILDSILFGGILNLIATLGLLVPGLAVGARRLHDTGRSGWWQLIGLIPFVGWIVLVVWFCQQGTAGPNQFGADPLQTLGKNASLARA